MSTFLFKTDFIEDRSTKQKLSDKLAAVDASLEDITKFKLIADIDGTTYLNGHGLDYSNIRNLQSYQLGQFWRKLLTGQSTQIACQGDSLTYGQDTTSADKRPADSVPCPDGSTHTITRAGQSYPEALQGYLQQIFGSQVSVINRGYSGDWLAQGYSRWYTQHTSDLTIIMYGTNDSRATWVPSNIRGNLQDYVNWYEQFIIREIVWGKGVIILTPPKLQTDQDVNIETFANALKSIGDKYGVPVIDAHQFTLNYPSTIFSDSVHHNTSGYRVFASKVAAALIGQVNNVCKVKDGNILLTRPNGDSIILYGGATFTTTGGSVETPAEVNTTTGIVASWSGTGKGVIYSFYAEENDLMVLPYVYSSTKNLRLTLDFNTVSSQNSIDDLVGATPGTLNETIAKQIVYTLPVTSPLYSDLIKGINDNSQLTLLRIVEKGWHTLQIDTTDPACTVILNGVYFMGYRNYKHERQILNNSSNDVLYSYFNANGNISVNAVNVLAQSQPSADAVLTLPQVSATKQGKIITIVKNDATAYNLVVQAYTGDTLYGNGTFTGQYTSRKFLNTGVGWVAFN